MLTTLKNKKIVLGVSGGIAAYKACDLLRRLKCAGCQVRVVMTASVKAFVTPLTFQALSGCKVYEGLLNASIETGMGHIELARWADAILIAPLTANSMANLAAGQAKDLLSAVCLATQAPIVIAPAMNQKMWSNPIVQANLDTLLANGFMHLGVGDGEQACGEIGPGRMLEPELIVEKLAACFLSKALSGKHVVLTAGPTREYIDPVRFISNPSTGKMGYALAHAAQEAGATVTLISGPVSLAPLANVTTLCVETAAEMHEAVLSVVAASDIFIATAAVGDYCVAQPAGQKLEKTDNLTLQLVQTPDILKTVATLNKKPFCLGFAAQTHDVLALAKQKLQEKQLDMICVNDISQPNIGFASDENQLTIITKEKTQVLKRASKTQLAKQIVNVIKEAYYAKQTENTA